MVVFVSEAIFSDARIKRVYCTNEHTRLRSLAWQQRNSHEDTNVSPTQLLLLGP